MIKYIVYIIGLVALIVLLWMFRDELAKLWAELFGNKEESQEETEAVASTSDVSASQPDFSQFKDPFQQGLIEKWPPAQTIQYSFEALEAWARGHHCPRERDQTPLEFARQLQQVDEEVAAQSRTLADLMGESLYSGGSVGRSQTLKLQRLWQAMNANAPTSQSSVVSSDRQLAHHS